MGIDPHVSPGALNADHMRGGHEPVDWITFTESNTGAERTWVVDANFLSSNYQCIWGNGCQGVLAEPSPELMQGCCSYGAHLVDDDDVQRVVRAYLRAAPLMQFAESAREEGFLRPGDEGPHSTATRVIDGACIFFNRPGAGPDQPDRAVGCSLHLAAVAAGERPLDWKPNVCWQIPIKLQRDTDANAQSTFTLRAWRRSDWDVTQRNGESNDDVADDDPGDEMAWWCTEAADAFSGSEPLFQSARDELVELMGDHAYELMVDHLQRRDRPADGVTSQEPTS